MANGQDERNLTAILAADVVGYSGLIEADESGTRAALRTLRGEVTDPQGDRPSQFRTFAEIAYSSTL